MWVTHLVLHRSAVVCVCYLQHTMGPYVSKVPLKAMIGLQILLPAWKILFANSHFAFKELGWEWYFSLDCVCRHPRPPALEVPL